MPRTETPTANAVRQRRYRNRVRRNEVVIPPLTVPFELIQLLVLGGRSKDQATGNEAAARLLVRAYLANK
jgi:hypothetical protein